MITSSQKKSEGANMSGDKEGTAQFYQPHIIQNNASLIRENDYIEPMSQEF